MLNIPYQFMHTKVLKRGSKYIYGICKILGQFFPTLNLNLQRSGLKMEVSDYLAMCIFNDLFLFGVMWLLFFLFMPKTNELSLVPPLLVIGFISIFIFISQLSFPAIIVHNKARNIEKNLVSALKTLQIESGSGVSLFASMVTIANEDYGEMSKEFKKVIHEINTGTKQTEALEKMVELNTSELFRRSMWQVITAMKTGADIHFVLKEIINSLTEEQIVQIQKYGSRLTPLAMFYMMLVVIIPSLSIVFLLIIGSLASVSGIGLKLIFWALFIFVAFIQYTFIGIIKSKRPVLLGD